ncbi:MAG TPA: CBS domain-containing protein [Sandaracinaceae bacterium LLY-WYZ-13_1]|nr:CBS domain-containing protein [Sandaracinaceae bacterium LLY-WYZ-13_1]
MTLASEPMTRRVIVVPPELPLTDAWAIMRRERFRHLPVVRDGAILGILSDRDVLLRAHLGPEGEVQPPDVPAAQAMSLAPYACEPDTDVADLVRTMTERKIDAMPVVDAAGRLVGLVTSTDLMLLLIRLDEAKAPLPFEWEIETVHPAAFA